MLQIGTHAEGLVVVADHHPLLLGVVGREEETGFGIATLIAQVVVLHQCVVDQRHGLPVGIHTTWVNACTRGLTAIRQLFVGDRYKLICIEQVETLQGVAESHRHVVGYFGFALRAFLRGDHHHTGCCTGSEDRSGRTILQDLDVLDVGRVDVAQGVGVGAGCEVTRDDGYSIHYEQGSGRLVDGVDTTNEDPGGLVNQTTGVGNLNTGRTTR